MIGCCTAGFDVCKDFDCKVEETANGITLKLTGEDPKKVEALKSLLKSWKELGGFNCDC